MNSRAGGSPTLHRLRNHCARTGFRDPRALQSIVEEFLLAQRLSCADTPDLASMRDLRTELAAAVDDFGDSALFSNLLCQGTHEQLK